MPFSWFPLFLRRYGPPLKALSLLGVCGLTCFCLAFTPCKVSAQEPSLTLLESVKSALESQPDIQFGKLDVEYAQYQYQEQSGQFDTKITTGVEHRETRNPLTAADYADHELQKDSSYHLGLEKQFRTGLVLSPELRTTRSEVDRDMAPEVVPIYDPYDPNHPLVAQKIINPDPSAPTPQNRSGVYLRATLPLLQGLGREAAAGLEMAAEQEAEVSRIELQHTISQTVQDVSLAYWKYVRDYQVLKLQREAEQRAVTLHEQTKSMVEVDEIAESELDESRANLSDKRTARISAEQSLIESRLDLGLAMGVPFERIRDLSLPSDNFQLLETAEENAAALDDAVLIELALQNRADLLASEGRQESAALRENVFEDRTRPSLDMGLEAGYEGLEEGESYGNMFEAPGSNVRGMSWQLSLTYEFPVQNRQARGRMLQQRVERRRQALQSRELTRDIKSNVHNAMSVLRQNILELENTRQTERLYEKAVENQQMKYRLGMGTLLDLIDTQDNLTQARMSKIEAYFKCSRALTSFKYQTATLVSFVQDEARVELKSLTDLPD